jgi:hypothetical protein
MGITGMNNRFWLTTAAVLLSTFAFAQSGTQETPSTRTFVASGAIERAA